MQARRTLDLPCPWVPLQSITAAASRRFPDRLERGAKLRGKATHLLEPIGCASGPGEHARRSAGRVSAVIRGKPLGDEAGCPKRDESLRRAWAEACVRRDTRPQVTTQSEHRAASFTCPGRSRDGCFLDAVCVAQATNGAPKLPRLRRSASRATLEGTIGEGMNGRTRRSGSSRAPSPGGCLPPVIRRSGSRAQDTQREFDDNSHGVRILSAFVPRRSLHRFTSPVPSALRVSHPLSGLSPPGPRGFVSRHIRPQDFGLQSFSLGVSRGTSRCSLLSCRFD